MQQVTEQRGLQRAMRTRMHHLVGITVSTVALLIAVRATAQDDLINQARRLDLEGKQDAAIALYRQALARTSNSFDAHYGIARALDLTGSYDEARQHFAKAIELAPEGARDQALRMMGVSYAFVGNAREAANYFRQVFDRRIAAGNIAGAAEVANELGRVYLELGDSENASKWYRAGYDTAARQADRSAADIQLADMRWAHAQARVAARRGDAREARRQQSVVKALLEKGSNADQQIQYPYLVGYVDFYLKDYAGAISELQKADQEDPFILMLLAEAYEKSGRTATARDYYRKVLASTSHAVNNAFARPIARQKLASTR
jgi:tetratricopeptide (TPR) repeat protein